MDPPKSTSWTLLERARNRDKEAWQRLVYLYSPLVDFWCKQWGVRQHDAEDVRQEVLQAVAASLEHFHRDQPGDTFRGWLRGITRNKVRDHFRARQGRPQAQGGSDAYLCLQEVVLPETEWAEEPQEELTGLYHRALELVRCEFEERTWQAFWRAAVDGQAPAEIAFDLGVTPAAVRKAKSRVLRRLREEAGELLEPQS